MRRRIFATGALIGALLLPAVAAAAPPPGRGRPTGPPQLPAQAAPPAGFRLADVAPQLVNRFDLLPDVAQEGGRDAGRRAGNCYPQGHPGYEEYCVNPNFIRVNASMFLHWPDLDTTAAHSLPVYVVDEIEGTRASEWLQWMIHDINTTWGGPSGRPWRPTFYYYGGAALRASNPTLYGHFSECGGNYWQFVEFCPRAGAPDGSTSFVDLYAWSPGSKHAGHAHSSDASIGARTIGADPDGAGPEPAANDQFVGYSVLHEGGHGMFGLAHTDECASPMTYCNVGADYKWRTPTDTWVMGMLYDGHGHN